MSIAQKRKQQILRAVDAMAQSNRLAFLTTQKISNASGISDGVLFRHFSSKEAILMAWVERHAHQQQVLLTSLPHGRQGLMQLVHHLLQTPELLSFVCCQPMDVPYLRHDMAQCRETLWHEMYARIMQLSCTPDALTAAALSDHLMQSLYRAWNPDNPEREQHKERLMRQLPWEKEEQHMDMMPSQEVLQRLAINDSGFVFDPLHGRSFSANAVGLYILRFLQNNQDMAALLDTLEKDFEVQRSQAERDVTEFFEQLRTCFA